MNLSPEQVGAVPQSGVNPLAKQAPTAPAQGQDIPPEAIQFFRQDPEIIAAVSKFLGRPVKMDGVPDNILTVVAGMVHKLGVDGAAAEMERIVPPDVAQQLKAGAV